MGTLKTIAKMIEILFVIIVVTSGVTHFLLVISIALNDTIFGTYNIFYLNPYMTMFSGLVVGMVATLVARSFLDRKENRSESNTSLDEFFRV